MFSNENAAVWLGPEMGTKIKTTAEKLFGVFLSYQRDTNYISHSPPIFTKAALCTLGAQPFQSPRTPCLRTIVEKACTVFRTLRQQNRDKTSIRSLLYMRYLCCVIVTERSVIVGFYHSLTFTETFTVGAVNA